MNKPFSKLASVNKPDYLLARINKDIKRRYYARVFGLGILQLASFASLCWSVVYVSDSLKTSGIYEYVSLVFTDGFGVFAYGREIALSIIESLPVMAFIILLVAGLATIVSAQKLYSHYEHA